MGMYEEDAYRLEESMFRFENMIDTTPTISSIAQFMKLEIKLVGFKYMPFDLKRFCLTIPAEFNSLEKTDDIHPSGRRPQSLASGCTDERD